MCGAGYSIAGIGRRAHRSLSITAIGGSVADACVIGHAAEETQRFFHHCASRTRVLERSDDPWHRKSPVATQHSLPSGRYSLTWAGLPPAGSHQLCLAHFAVGTRVTSRPPHRSVRAQFGHTACMGLSLSRVVHTIFSRLVFHSFVRPAPRAFFRPDRILPSPSRAARVKDGASSAPPKARP